MLALAPLAFVSYAVSDSTRDVALLRAQEVFVGYAVMLHFLVVGKNYM